MVDGGNEADGEEQQTDFFERNNDPDAYKDDWWDSLVFKKAMKAEAIKRGLRYDSDFSVDDAEDDIDMTTQKETCTGDADILDPVGSNSDDQENTQDAQHDKMGIGFMKKFSQ